MVLESIFLPILVEKNKKYSFFLGVIYAFISLIAAYVLFPNNFIIVAVAFNSLLLLPLVRRLLEIQKDIEAKTEGFNLKTFYKNHKDIFQVYFFIFLGIGVSFALFSLLTPLPVINNLFANQEIIVNSIYRNNIQFGDFSFIFSNNIKVLIVVYLAAYFFGTGAVFIIAWNASVWGTIFGAIANNASIITNQNPFVYFFLMSIVFLPHLLLEASSYFLAGISGGIVSKGLEKEKISSNRFARIMKKSLFLLWLSMFFILIAATVESSIAPILSGIILG